VRATFGRMAPVPGGTGLARLPARHGVRIPLTAARVLPRTMKGWLAGVGAERYDRAQRS